MKLNCYFYLGSKWELGFGEGFPLKGCAEVFPIESLEGVCALYSTHAIRKYSVHSLFDLKLLLSNGALKLPKDIKMCNAKNNSNYIIAYTENNDEENVTASLLGNTPITGLAVYMPFDSFRKLI